MRRRTVGDPRIEASRGVLRVSDPFPTGMAQIPTSQPDVQQPAAHASTSRSRASASRASRRSSASATTATSSSSHAELDCFVDLGANQKGAHMSRFEEVVNDAIGEVILGEAPFKAETLAQHIAEQRARAPGRPARRGHDRRALPRAQAGAGVRHPDAGDLHAATAPRSHRAHGTRRLIGVARPGHDRMPVRAGAGRGRARASGWTPTASTTTRSSASSRPSPSPPTTSAGSARCTSAAPRSATTRSTRATCSRSSRTRCRRRSTS